MKKAVLKNFVVFTGKFQACNFTEKRLQHRCFPLNIAKFLRTSILKNIYEQLLLIITDSSPYPRKYFCQNKSGIHPIFNFWPSEINGKLGFPMIPKIPKGIEVNSLKVA